MRKSFSSDMRLIAFPVLIWALIDSFCQMRLAKKIDAPRLFVSQRNGVFVNVFFFFCTRYA